MTNWDSEGWSPWVEWNIEDSCPLTAGYFVQLTMNRPISDGCDIRLIHKNNMRIISDWILEYVTGNADKWGNWKSVMVTHYRIRKPRGLTILEALLQPVEECDKVGGDMEVV